MYSGPLLVLRKSLRKPLMTMAQQRAQQQAIGSKFGSNEARGVALAVKQFRAAIVDSATDSIPLS